MNTWNQFSDEDKWNFWLGIVNDPCPSARIRELVDNGWVESYFPELHAVRNTPQDAKWHPEGVVFEHLMQSVDVAAELSVNLSEFDRTVNVISALCHDFGKENTTELHECGKISSRGHESEGVRPTIHFLRRINAPEDICNAVPALVRWHMLHVTDLSAKTVRKVMRKFSSTTATIEHLAVLFDADTGGRGTASHRGLGAFLLEVANQVSASDSSSETVSGLRGKFLVSLGYSPSPAFKEIIRDYENTGLDLSDPEMEMWVNAWFAQNYPEQA